MSDSVSSYTLAVFTPAITARSYCPSQRSIDRCSFPRLYERRVTGIIFRANTRERYGARLHSTFTSTPTVSGFARVCLPAIVTLPAIQYIDARFHAVMKGKITELFSFKGEDTREIRRLHVGVCASVSSFSRAVFTIRDRQLIAYSIDRSTLVRAIYETERNSRDYFHRKAKIYSERYDAPTVDVSVNYRTVTKSRRTNRRKRVFNPPLANLTSLCQIMTHDKTLLMLDHARGDKKPRAA